MEDEIKEEDEKESLLDTMRSMGKGRRKKKTMEGEISQEDINAELSEDDSSEDEPDRSAYNCTRCKGEGFENYAMSTICRDCNGTGKVEEAE